jgi:hypothetical protein
MSKTAEGQRALERAASETEVCFELVFCIPPHGFAMFASQRKRFEKREHAEMYAALNVGKLDRGTHFAILHGTRAQVAATPLMMSKDDLEDQTGDMALPSDYRFGIAYVDKNGVPVDHEIDNDIMRYVKRESAQAALDFIDKYMWLPNKTRNPNAKKLAVVPVVGMEGAV